MGKWLVRMGCEWSALVDADDVDQAMANAEALEDAQWDKAWSGVEAEEYSEESDEETKESHAAPEDLS